MYKIIFLDLDGTLLNDKKEVLEESKTAIKRAKENEIEVALCSGRQKNFIENCMDTAGTGDYLISTNGSAIYDCANNEELFASHIDKDLCEDLYNLAVRKDFLIRLDTKYARYINDMKYYLVKEIVIEEDINKFLSNNNILQVTIAAKEEKDIDETIKYLKSKSFVKVENKYRAPIGENYLWFINIINTSVSKGNAISGLCKYLKIDLKDTVAFGDDLNDISMLQTVGLGVAMGNALPEVKRYAKKIIGDNNRPSIAECINEIIEENNKKLDK